MFVTKPTMKSIKAVTDLLKAAGNKYVRATHIYITITSDDEAVLKRFEPLASSYAERVECLRYLAGSEDFGGNVNVMCEPYLSDPTTFVPGLLQILPATGVVAVGKMNYTASMKLSANEAEDASMKEYLAKLYTNENVMRVYHTLAAGNPRVFLKKDSIQAVLKAVAAGKRTSCTSATEQPKASTSGAQDTEQPKASTSGAQDTEQPQASTSGAQDMEQPKASTSGAPDTEQPKASTSGAQDTEQPKASTSGAQDTEQPKASTSGAQDTEQPKAGTSGAQDTEQPKAVDLITAADIGDAQAVESILASGEPVDRRFVKQGYNKQATALSYACRNEPVHSTHE
jgi:hypothetical protein